MSKQQDELFVAVDKGNIDNIKQALASGADVNAKNYREDSPLNVAVTQQNHEAIQLLINNGANVNAKNSMGSSVLHKAVMNKDPVAIQLLVNKGADVNVTNNYNETPIITAAENHDLAAMQILVENGADVNVRSYEDKTLLHLVSTRDIFGNTMANRDEAIKLLVLAGALVEPKDLERTKVGLKLSDKEFDELFDEIKGASGEIIGHLAKDRTSYRLEEDVYLNISAREPIAKVLSRSCVVGGALPDALLLVADYLPKKNDKAAVLCAAKQGRADDYSIRDASWGVKASFADKFFKSNESFTVRFAEAKANYLTK